jgi:hypothetical protein
MDKPEPAAKRPGLAIPASIARPERSAGIGVLASLPCGACRSSVYVNRVRRITSICTLFPLTLVPLFLREEEGRGEGASGGHGRLPMIPCTIREAFLTIVRTTSYWSMSKPEEGAGCGIS